MKSLGAPFLISRGCRRKGESPPAATARSPPRNNDSARPRLLRDSCSLCCSCEIFGGLHRSPSWAGTPSTHDGALGATGSPDQSATSLSSPHFTLCGRVWARARSRGERSTHDRPNEHVAPTALPAFGVPPGSLSGVESEVCFGLAAGQKERRPRANKAPLRWWRRLEGDLKRRKEKRPLSIQKRGGLKESEERGGGWLE